MIRLYSDRRAERILRRWAPEIRAAAGEYGLPEAAIRAILWQEITRIDLGDPAADALVALNWALYRLDRRLRGREKAAAALRRRKGPLSKRDSSTGYAQIFAWVAIDAVNFALDRGICTLASLGLEDRRPDRTDPDDLCWFWRRLRRDRAFNLRAGALNLLAAAAEITGQTDLTRCSPEEMQRIFSRYNAGSGRITEYGRQAYCRYQIDRAASRPNPERRPPMDFIIENDRIFLPGPDGAPLAEITFPETAPGEFTIDHTFVDPSLRGQGVAGRLVAAAAAEIRRRNGAVKATCSYAAVWLEKHPDARGDGPA